MMASRTKSRRETSVIARIRAGSSCTLGPYTIAMIITEALQEYRDILSIGFSSTNFTIGLNSTDFQLAVLYSRIIEESDLILDILPWCSEYVNFNLPWIIQRKNKVTPPNQLSIYMNNLTGQGKLSQQCIRRAIEKHCAIPHSSDNTQETNQIIIDGLTGMGKLSSMPDFSYLMILELKNFYKDKFRAFRKCAQSCQELCDCAYQLSTDLEPSFASIVAHILSIKDNFTEEMQFLITDFAQDINSEGLYIGEELFGIGRNIHLLYASMNPIIDLTKFKSSIHIIPDNVPTNYTSRLQIILNVVARKIYGTSTTINTEATSNGNFITYISNQKFSDHHKSVPMVTQAEAETDAIYRFLRHKTNVLGYNIVDINYSTLVKLVSEINKYNEEVNELLLCASKAATMIEQVHKDISKIHRDFLQKIRYGNIIELTTLLNNLLISTETYSKAAKHGLQIFRQNKENYESIILETKYRSTPAQ